MPKYINGKEIEYWEDIFLHNKQVDVNLLREFCNRSLKELKHWRSALLHLTPGGHKYSQNPQECFRFVKRTRGLLLKKLNNA